MRPELLEATDVIRYATTAATNAIVQMKGPKIGLLVSAGCARAMSTRGKIQSSQEIWNFLDKSLVAGLEEAVDDEGAVSAVLDEESLRKAIEQVLDGGARLLVVALQGADRNPANELRARELFEKPCCRRSTLAGHSCCFLIRSALPGRTLSDSTVP